MAGLEDLATFLVLGDAQKKAIAEDDPYSGGQQLGSSILQAIAGDTVQRPNASSNRERIAGAALSGLFGGLFGGLSNNYRARATDAYQNEIANTIMGIDSEKPRVLSSSLYGDAKQRGSIFKIGAALQQKQLENETNKLINVENAKSFNNIGEKIIDGLKSANPRERANAQKLAASLGLGGLVGADAPEVQPIGAPVKEGGRFGGGESIADKLERETQRYLEAGVSPSAAGELASRAIEGDRIANRAQAKRIEDLRARNAKLDEIIGTAETGIQGAGNTGGALGGVRDLASSAWALFSPEEQKQRDSQRLLDSITPDVVKASRSPGALSDREMAILVGSGPSSRNTPSENTALVDRLKAVRGLEGEYADFLDTYLAEKGDLRGADQLWERYKKDNPLFVQDETGALKPNTDRMPWHQYDFTGTGAQTGATAPAAPATNPIQPSAANQAALRELAKRFPNTPEGKAQFKAAVAELEAQ